MDFPENLYPNESTMISKRMMEDYTLKVMRISKFEYDFELWNKLRQMEEYRTHAEFNYFVQMLEHKLFTECFPENTVEVLGK